MMGEGRVVTAKLPDDIVTRLDDVAERMDRTKSWIVREAVDQWLAEEQRRHELTLEALADVDSGRTVDQAEIEAHFAGRRKERARAATAA